MHYAVNAKECR